MTHRRIAGSEAFNPARGAHIVELLPARQRRWAIDPAGLVVTLGAATLGVAIAAADISRGDHRLFGLAFITGLVIWGGHSLLKART